jgi:hypothetical protein
MHYYSFTTQCTVSRQSPILLELTPIAEGLVRANIVTTTILKKKMTTMDTYISTFIDSIDEPAPDDIMEESRSCHIDQDMLRSFLHGAVQEIDPDSPKPNRPDRAMPPCQLSISNQAKPSNKKMPEKVTDYSSETSSDRTTTTDERFEHGRRTSNNERPARTPNNEQSAREKYMKPKSLGRDFTPSEWDVLCGRGKGKLFTD